ncbi:MAG: glycosyltransferase [Cyanobacteria bacterium J06639_1]
MILVTVGTEQFPFDRLMEWIDVLLEMNVFREDVVVQYGSSTVRPRDAVCHRLLPEADFKAVVREARVVIAHCGEGSLLTLSEAGVPFVLVPRSAQFGEHVDDHQLELACVLEDRGVPIARSPGELLKLVATIPENAGSSTISLASDRICGLLSAEKRSLQNA